MPLCTITDSNTLTIYTLCELLISVFQYVCLFLQFDLFLAFSWSSFCLSPNLVSVCNTTPNMLCYDTLSRSNLICLILAESGKMFLVLVCVCASLGQSKSEYVCLPIWFFHCMFVTAIVSLFWVFDCFTVYLSIFVTVLWRCSL